MQQAIKFCILALCLSLLICALAACGDVRGVYTRTVGETLATTYEFDTWSNSVRISERIGSEVYEYTCTYEISDDEKSITFYDENEKTVSTEQFEQGEDYVKIGVIKYYKQA